MTLIRMNGFQIGDKRLKVQHKRVRAAGAAAAALSGEGGVWVRELEWEEVR